MTRKKVSDQPKEKIDRIFLSFTEAQEYLGVSHQTLYQLMKEGLESHKIGRKRVFLKEDLEKWIREH
jgi:excisionase family DNA binding protein